MEQILWRLDSHSVPFPRDANPNDNADRGGHRGETRGVTNTTRRLPGRWRACITFWFEMLWPLGTPASAPGEECACLSIRCYASSEDAAAAQLAAACVHRSFQSGRPERVSLPLFVIPRCIASCIFLSFVKRCKRDQNPSDRKFDAKLRKIGTRRQEAPGRRSWIFRFREHAQELCSFIG